MAVAFSTRRRTTDPNDPNYDPANPTAPTTDPTQPPSPNKDLSSSIDPNSPAAGGYQPRTGPIFLPGGPDIPAPGQPGPGPGSPDNPYPGPPAPAPPPPPPTPPPTPPPPPAVDPWRAYVDKGFAASGHAPPTEEDYALWGQYWNQWGSGNPDYFLSRMIDVTRPGGGMPNLPASMLPPTGDLPAFPSGGGRDIAADPNVDPFASMGGGIYMNGNWVPKDYPGAQEWLAAHPAGVTQAGAGTASGSTGIPTTAAINDAVRARLLKMLNPEDITPESLAQTPEAAAYRLTSQRGHERDVAQLGEDAAVGNFTGTPEQEAKRRGLGEQRGEAEASFMGQLAMTRLQAQREDIQNAIADAQNQGQFEAAQALQLQLAQMDDAIKRMQIQQTAATAASDIALRRELGLGGLAQDRYATDVGAATSRYGTDASKEVGLSNVGLGQSELQYRAKLNIERAKLGLPPI